jgi:hypothetical protein
MTDARAWRNNTREPETARGKPYYYYYYYYYYSTLLYSTTKILK